MSTPYPFSTIMAEADTGGESNSKSFSMRMAIYGISKKFPSVRNVSCDQLEKWRQETQDKLVILVSSRLTITIHPLDSIILQVAL